MYIIMITGSPHRHGSSALLVDEFIVVQGDILFKIFF